MEFAYLDESGDLGASGSKYLVLALMCTSKKKEIIRIVRDIKVELLRHNKTSRWLNRNSGELKFYGFPDKVILDRALNRFSHLNMHVYFVALEKSNIKIGIEFKSVILGELFRHILKNASHVAPQKIVADVDFFNHDKINYFLLQNYDIVPTKLKNDDGDELDVNEEKMLFSRIDVKTYNEFKKTDKLLISVEHQNSVLSEELQALDLICGSIFCSLEHQRTEYLDVLKKHSLKIIGHTLKVSQK